MKLSLPSAPHLVYERRLLRGAAALATVRHEVAAVLEAEGASDRMIQDTLLVLSELGTNAMHAVTYHDEVLVRLAMDPSGDVMVEVEDPGAGFRLSEGLRLPDTDEEHGRGLSIVCLVADETSVRRKRRHTIVQARICNKRSA